MADEKKNDSSLGKMIYGEMERALTQFLGAENRQNAQSQLGGALQKGIDSVQFAMELITDFTKDLSGVESFNIIPKPPAELEVDIKLRKEMELPFKQTIVPLVEMEALKLGKRIHFQAHADMEAKELRCDIHEGFTIVLSTILGKQNVPLKGNAVLKRDKNKQVVLETTTAIPGIPMPITISIPLKTILSHAGKKIV